MPKPEGIPEPLLRLDHVAPTRPRRAAITPYDVAKLGFFLFGLPRNAFGSIDVSKECNLRCAHCYFFDGEEGEAPAYRGRRELGVEEWIAKLTELKRTTSRLEFPFFQCTWVGGEPLIRKELIESGRALFRFNTVVTNGTIPLPNWPDVNWYVSIDGDEETHERIRRKRGIYRRAMRNVADNPHLRVTIAYCITRQNVHCIEQAMIDWAAAGAHQMTFDFYTPMGPSPGDANPVATSPRESGTAAQFIPLAERDLVLDRLLALKQIYGDFFALPRRALELMKSDVCKEVSDHCLFASKGFAFGPDGTRKEKCMMGPDADCDRCGCVVPFYLASLTDRRRIVHDLAREMRSAARRAAAGVITAVVD